ncbi:MAG TPA: GAF domain-containing protein [Plasticicumulans sp.]|uniref:GAF domain-containing protein n=1 Tax=Plasticicumulans sp. TaxID=2307179 RepID=UPI002C5ADFBF|nr:GAF domain-containing protein [Plasticicumulans sp.]
METFIRVTEIWIPTRDRTRLELGAGLYGPLEEFEALSRTMQFGYDEGLPGKAWAAGHPVILKGFEGSYFQRTEAAQLAGLTCGIAVPVFAGDFLLAVMVLFCGDDEAHVGAIEVWHNDPAVSHDMSLLDGYYGTAELFEWTSRRVSFRPGTGLPGMVWESGMPVALDDLGDSNRFLREDCAVKVGINRGLGIPVSRNDDQHYVLTFLSALGTPIAHRFEIWTPATDGTALLFDSGHCEASPELAEFYAEAHIGLGEGVLGKAWLSGLPGLSRDLPADPSIAARAALSAGLTEVVALPVIRNGQLKAIVAWYF